MLRTPVQSSNLASVGYDAGSNVLEIEFHNGGIYQYSRVPKMIYEGLMSADSKGKYFHRNIKNVYPCVKVG